MRLVESAAPLFALLLVAAALADPSTATADSAAAKNREGNALFQKGQYQDAEKAYLEAHLGDPARPELLYNLGNALEKQKKYDKAAQLLRQAVSKGDKGLQANGWYNLGNSLFEGGSYQEAAQAYIQALRINPADRDAKHNLELAWRKVQEQKNASSDKNQKDDKNKPDSGKNQQQAQGNQNKNRDQNQQEGAGDEKDRKQAEQPQPSQAEHKEGTMSRERAMQILDAMKNQELMEARKLAEKQARRKSSGKDW